MSMSFSLALHWKTTSNKRDGHGSERRTPSDNEMGRREVTSAKSTASKLDLIWTVWDGGSSRRHLSPTSISQVINPCRLCLHRWESLQHNSLVKGNYKRQRWKVSKVDLTRRSRRWIGGCGCGSNDKFFAKQKTDIICNGYILIRSWIRRWCRSNSQF